jgi:hypothetical protein
MKDLGRKFAFLVPIAIFLAWLLPHLIRWRGLAEIIEAEGFLLGILCFVFAVQQYSDAKEQISTLAKHTSTLDEVREGISTRFLAVFPHCISDITRFISEGPHDLDIMVDFSGYGQYSVPEQFKAYFTALENCARTCKVRMLVYGPPVGKEAIQEQWPGDCLESESNDNRLARFLDEHQDLIQPRTSEEFLKQVTYDQFVDLQWRAQMQSQIQLTRIKNINIRYLDRAQLVMLAWIRADDHVIFSFKNRGAKLRELAFNSRDTALVPVFRAMFERLWHESDPQRELVAAQAG